MAPHHLLPFAPRSEDSTDDSTPPSPHSYFFPLLLVVIACGGYIYWRRLHVRSSRPGVPLSFPSSEPAGIRLSEDGPPTHSFISNNASTDSLPFHALTDLPTLPQHPARTSPLPSTRSDLPLPRLSSHGSTASGGGALGKSPSGVAGFRRSMRGKGRGKGPVEGGEESTSESEEEGEGEGVKTGARFEIGDGEEDLIGPLGR
ncbi:hypothetical protein IAT38_002112 [Cryptococcus sp. DSM 104549]